MAPTSDMELKIIEAAITCIESFGIGDTTVRRIAQEAGVNVAAINYYFHTKDRLMERVMETTLENAFNWHDFESSRDLPPKPRLVAILEHLTAGAQAYPEITRAHFIVPVMERNTNAAAYRRYNEFLGELYDDLAGRGAVPGERLRHAIIQAASATILGIGLMLELYEEFAGQDLRNPELRRRYIERLVDSVL